MSLLLDALSHDSSREDFPRRCRAAADAEDVFERGEDEHDVLFRAARAHEADADGFAFERAEASADLDAVFVEQTFAQRGFIDAVRRVDRFASLAMTVGFWA